MCYQKNVLTLKCNWRNVSGCLLKCSHCGNMMQGVFLQLLVFFCWHVIICCLFPQCLVTYKFKGQCGNNIWRVWSHPQRIRNVSMIVTVANSHLLSLKLQFFRYNKWEFLSMIIDLSFTFIFLYHTFRFKRNTRQKLTTCGYMWICSESMQFSFTHIKIDHFY